MNWFNGSVLY